MVSSFTIGHCRPFVLSIVPIVDKGLRLAGHRDSKGDDRHARICDGRFKQAMTEAELADQKQVGSSSAAARMRRHRERRRDGLRCLNIELRATEIGELITRGFLAPDARNEQAAVRDALYAFLDRTLNP